MRVAIIEPYFGGSHRSWAEGYQRASGHDVIIVSHDSRFWKWRMQGSFVTLAAETRELVRTAGAFDVVLASSMLDVAGFLGLLSDDRRGAPVALYMHENQLTYPTSPRDSPDDTYPMINWSSMVAADAVFFNSRFHRDSWFESIPQLLNRFPDNKHTHLVEEVADRSTVLPVGVDLARFDSVSAPANPAAVLLWNHRWDHDKGPDVLVAALKQLVERDVEFEMIVTGEHVPSFPQHRAELSQVLGDRLRHVGEVDDERYVELVAAADVVVSTARQEFFGISVTEAMYAGAFPILPDRLVYPERIPAGLHDRCLYGDTDGLVDRCIWAISNRGEAAEIGESLTPLMAEFDWAELGAEYDSRLESLGRGRP